MVALKLIPLILSGGAGTRLWPLSREAAPKPFMPLPDGETLLGKTARRAGCPRRNGPRGGLGLQGLARHVWHCADASGHGIWLCRMRRAPDGLRPRRATGVSCAPIRRKAGVTDGTRISRSRQLRVEFR